MASRSSTPHYGDAHSPFSSSREWRQGQDGHGSKPKGYTRADERILDDVCDRLWRDPGLDVSAVTVTVLDGNVRLEGSIQDREQKRRAEIIAGEVSGVLDVHNSVRVRGPERTDDTEASQGTGDRATANASPRDDAARVSGMSTSAEATGTSASSYGAGLELGRGDTPPAGKDTTLGTTNPTKVTT